MGKSDCDHKSPGGSFRAAAEGIEQSKEHRPEDWRQQGDTTPSQEMVSLASWAEGDAGGYIIVGDHSADLVGIGVSQGQHRLIGPDEMRHQIGERCIDRKYADLPLFFGDGNQPIIRTDHLQSFQKAQILAVVTLSFGGGVSLSRVDLLSYLGEMREQIHGILKLCIRRIFIVRAPILRIRHQVVDYKESSCKETCNLQARKTISLRAGRNQPTDDTYKDSFFGEDIQSQGRVDGNRQDDKRVDAARPSALPDLIDGAQDDRHGQKPVELAQSAQDIALAARQGEHQHVDRHSSDHTPNRSVQHGPVSDHILEKAFARLQLARDEDGDVHSRTRNQVHQHCPHRSTEIRIPWPSYGSFDGDSDDDRKHGVRKYIGASGTRKTLGTIKGCCCDQNEEEAEQTKERSRPLQELHDQEGHRKGGSPGIRDAGWKGKTHLLRPYLNYERHRPSSFPLLC